MFHYTTNSVEGVAEGLKTEAVKIMLCRLTKTTLFPQREVLSETPFSTQKRNVGVIQNEFSEMSAEHSATTKKIFRKSFYGKVITWEGIEKYSMMSLKKPHKFLKGLLHSELYPSSKIWQN